MANIIIICNLLSTRNFNPHTYRTQSQWKRKWKCIYAARVCAPINCQMRIPITLFSASPFAHSLCPASSLSFLSALVGSYLANFILFSSARRRRACVQHSPPPLPPSSSSSSSSVLTSFSKLSLFLMHISIYDWNEPYTTSEWVNDANVNAKENGYRVSQSTSLCEMRSFAITCALHTQSHTHRHIVQRNEEIIIIAIDLLVILLLCFVFVRLPFQKLDAQLLKWLHRKFKNYGEQN